MGFIQITRAAREDLRNIGRYTQQAHGPAQRRRYLASFDQAFDLLLAMPQIAKERLEFNPPVRFYRHHRHYIVYTSHGAGIRVIRVLHIAMDVGLVLGEVRG